MELVNIDPVALLTFRNKEAQIQVRSVVSEGLVTFKIKTTEPKMFTVKPNSGVVKPGQSIFVNITLNSSDKSAVESTKFLVQAAKLANPNEDLTAFWTKVAKSDMQSFKLQVKDDGVVEQEIKSNSQPNSNQSSSQEQQAHHRHDRLRVHPRRRCRRRRGR